MLDDLVYIAQNGKIGIISFVVAQASIFSCVVIGCHCWSNPYALISDSIAMVDNPIVGVAGNYTGVFGGKQT